MNKKSTLSEIINKKKQIERELKELEDKIYQKETDYLNNTQTTGNLVKGWEFVSYKVANPTSVYFNKQNVKTGDAFIPGKSKIPGKFLADERVFSNSSTTAPLQNDYGEAPLIKQSFVDYSEYSYQPSSAKLDDVKAGGKGSIRNRGSKKAIGRK